MAHQHNQLLVLDRLSSLPDEILVDILSFLPLKSAIITDTLSKRWRHLWTQITSVVIGDRNVDLKDNLITSVDQSIHKLTSPFIRTFIIDFQVPRAGLVAMIPIDSWLRRICQRNVLHIDVSLHDHIGRFCEYKVRWPSCIFRTRSLVSIDMRSVRINCPCYDELIDLPNLKKHSLNVTPLQCDWLTKLTESCPLLEDLSFKIKSISTALDVKYSCPNLRRLSIVLFGFNQACKVVINAPKLEYLDASLYTDCALCIGDKPIIRLHEVQLNILRYIKRDLRTDGVEGCDLQLSKAISNVRSLNLRFFKKNTFTTTTFPNLTHLTLNLGSYCKFRTVMSFVELCPVLDVLALRFKDRPLFGKGESPDNLSTRTLERVKEIRMDVCYNELELEEHFTKIIHWLLKRSSVLERFCFNVVVARSLKTTASYARSEHMLCDLLYNCPRASIDCEVSFTGQFWLMTRKDGLDVLKRIADAVN